MLTKVEAILFDLDETLTDRSASMSRYAALFHRDFTRHLRGITVAEVESTLVALDQRGYRPRDEVYACIVSWLGKDSGPNFSVVRDHWRTWFPASAVGRSGLDEALNQLVAHSIRLGIVTNGSVLTQSAKIEHLGIGRFLATIVISEAVHCEKPDARIFRLALEEIGSDPAATWFVGDHPVNDILGSAAAGLSPVWLEGIQPWPEGHQNPGRQIQTLRELVALVGRERFGAT